MFEKFLRLVNNPFKFRLFLLAKLPAAYFSGVKVRYADEDKCVVTIPYKWFSKNPFRSTYFACLSMAAEMSTGVLAMGHTYRQSPSVSMLVVRVEANFMKKATGITTFLCEDGSRIRAAVRQTMASGKPASLSAFAAGKNKEGETVAEFNITWSFKAKT